MSISLDTSRGNHLSAQPKASRGSMIARLLAGAWRSTPPLPDISVSELGEITELLMKSGASSLAWCKIRHSTLGASPDGQKLQQAYRHHAIRAALHERGMREVISLLRSYGAEPVVVKGWAAARLYSAVGMRPYTDLDLCVLPDHYDKAREALKSSVSHGCLVDLHLGFGKFFDQHADDVFNRSRLVRQGDFEVRVLSAEDDLRFLCMHLLRHGAVRPFWLCDIAASVESRSKDFDWDRCLTDSPRQADWIACVIGLAHQLLDARIEGTPVVDRAARLPKWLMPTVLEEWAKPFHMPAQIAFYLRHPVKQFRRMLEELPQHWPNSIEATVNLKGPFNDMPRLPFQVGHLFYRAAALVAEVPKMLRPAKS